MPVAVLPEAVAVVPVPMALDVVLLVVLLVPMGPKVLTVIGPLEVLGLVVTGGLCVTGGLGGRTGGLNALVFGALNSIFNNLLFQ